MTYISKLSHELPVLGTYVNMYTLYMDAPVLYVARCKYILGVVHCTKQNRDQNQTVNSDLERSKRSNLLQHLVQIHFLGHIYHLSYCNMNNMKNQSSPFILNRPIKIETQRSIIKVKRFRVSL